MKDDFPYVIASEGGHTTYAPEQKSHLKFLLRQDDFRKRSFEQALSGPGLENIYTHLHPTYKKIDAEEIIRRSNENDNDPIALEAVDLFCEMLAIFCGNMALVFNCDKAVYLWGSVIKDIKSNQLTNAFKDHFSERKHKDKL